MISEHATSELIGIDHSLPGSVLPGDHVKFYWCAGDYESRTGFGIVIKVEYHRICTVLWSKLPDGEGARSEALLMKAINAIKIPKEYFGIDKFELCA